MSVFTALIFLNIGFVMMEVKILGFDKNRQLMENISKMLAGAAFEEERDTSPQSSTQSLAEEECLPGHQAASYSGCYFLIAEHASFLRNDGRIENGYRKKHYPPPEI